MLQKINIGFLALAVAILVYVGYRLRLIQAYIAYWSEASRETGPDDVSAKRAVFIHGAVFGAAVILCVVAKAQWQFTKESLDAFETFLYITVGGYVGGKIADAIATKIQTKTSEGAQS